MIRRQNPQGMGMPIQTCFLAALVARLEITHIYTLFNVCLFWFSQSKIIMQNQLFADLLAHLDEGLVIKNHLVLKRFEFRVNGLILFISLKGFPNVAGHKS